VINGPDPYWRVASLFSQWSQWQTCNILCLMNQPTLQPSFWIHWLALDTAASFTRVNGLVGTGPLASDAGIIRGFIIFHRNLWNRYIHNSDTQFTINGKIAYTLVLIGDLQWKFRTILSFWAVGSWFQLVKYRLTANCSTKGANENFPIWDVFKGFSISRPVLNGFGCKMARYTRLIHAELAIERNL
jgi:hypothetical protein